MSQVKCQITDLGLGRELQLFSPSLSLSNTWHCAVERHKKATIKIFFCLEVEHFAFTGECDETEEPLGLLLAR